ncbi:hypothetical protein ACYX34_10310 [Nitrospira sp. CMX1]
MKGMLIAISGAIVFASSLAYGQSGTQLIEQQLNQEDWIERSFDRGQLDRQEATRLDHEQTHRDRIEKSAKRDGAVTRKETGRIGAAKKRASRPIARERHDRQDARHR